MLNNNFYILNIDSKFNLDLLPVHINDTEVIDDQFSNFDNCKYLRSQYSLEIVLHRMFKHHKNLVSSYDDANIVFIPIYLFCSAWSKRYYYDVNQIVNNINSISPLINKCIIDNKRVVIVYSDVMWEDSRCFLNYFNFHKNVYFICYESVISNNNQIEVPYCTHIKEDPRKYDIPKKSNKQYLISYAGRYRKEITYFNNIKILNTNKIQDDKWISINNINTYNEIDSMYLDSYFSLQPHGDKKSRKGFYHSLLLGCIPVVFDDNYDIYKNVLGDMIDIEDIAVILNKDDTNYECRLEKELTMIESKIHNIAAIKHLLLYDENDTSIVDLILNKINYKK
jgi:hypothetical protein